MGDWVVGAVINIIGSIAINFGTNLLKLGHDQRERHSMLMTEESNKKFVVKSIIHFQTWRIGILFFALGNCLNFFSFAYAAQSLLSALGSVQFISNIVFAYFVLSKTVSVKVMAATAFIVFGNIFLVSFGNHLSPVYTPEQLIVKYNNYVFLLYCVSLLSIVGITQYIYRKGEMHCAVSRHDNRSWRMLLPFSYAIVSGAVGSCSVLFAKSLSNMLRLTMISNYRFHSLFTYSMMFLFLLTAGFWMTRLNKGLSLFDAILIVPMFQIVWTFFSILTGFVYFQEYQVLNTQRMMLFAVGMIFVFIGISLLAPDDDSKGNKIKISASQISSTQGLKTDTIRPSLQPIEETENEGSFSNKVFSRLQLMLNKAKDLSSLPVSLDDHSISASSVLTMPMVSSRPTGFREKNLERTEYIPLQNSDWNNFSLEDDDYDTDIQDTRPLI